MKDTPITPSPAAPATDVSGFEVFSGGDAGAAHVLAHRMLDENRMEEGYRLLEAWLSRHERQESAAVHDSDWIHLQWHMAVFEISTGRVREAGERFRREILPSVPLGKALTDAPSLLWRLSLAAAETMDLDWRPVHDVARSRIAKSADPGDVRRDPYVELHHLMALAGAGDLELLTRWLDERLETAGDETRDLLLRLGFALRTYATRDYEVAATLLAGSVEPASRLGGSRAQNELFAELAEQASRLGRAPVAA